MCGLVVNGSVKGKSLLTMCNPEKLSEPFVMDRSDRASKDKVWLVRLSMDGEVLGKICKADQLAGLPAISPDGKYIAYNIYVRENDKRKQSLKLIEAESGKEVFSADGPLLGVDVSNEGEVIAWDGVRIQHGKLILTGKRLSRDGKAVIIAENVPAKLVSWNSTFYLERTGDGNEHPWVIKKLDFNSPAVK